ncbi:MAG TPA: ABC transporter permease subunit [Candidatus Sumerlaeota bacterium]|nr:MAG: L-arabinose transport system permease protein AraQ [candidate division BRC1 bacterium ADurb.Bin183]HOE62293.1 ABC transporter permease subunit [Candidatus Sumerlaeota bacterium]HRR30314.1 ABC transporter permease subunit [Candidatus Sumerlaeia bacterium]HON49208.1 ABC transporter permease subunit [Candidatus Sumerlaeota bacterium]HOR64185.1 ABC transporter permease subunit [Candidatus Sumerlaeota bacterium]
MKERTQRQIWGWAFLSPTLLLFFVFAVIPMFLALLLAFKDYMPARGFWGSPWVGLQNFHDIFGNVLMRDRVLRAFKNTLFFTIIFVPVNIIASMVIATLIYSVDERARKFYRSAFYLPTVTSAIIFAMIWRWLYDYNFGLLNWALSWFGVGKINWLGDPRWSMFAVILAAIGAGPGGNILIYLAGLARVPSECIEAARVDGANAVQRWWHVTLPLLRPITLYLVVLNTIGSFQVFELVFTLTSGGPASSSTVLVYEIYSLAFANGYYGQAGALSLLLLLIVTGFAVLQFKIFRTDLEETRPPTIFDKAIDGVSNLIEWTAGGVWNLIQIPSELLKKRRATARGTGQLRPKLRLRLLPFFTKNAAHVILMPLSLLLLVPMIWMFLSAFTPGVYLQSTPPDVRPKNFALDNYKSLLEATMSPRTSANTAQTQPRPAGEKPPLADNWRDFFRRCKLFRWLGNTVYLALLITFLQSMLSNLAAYPLAKIRFKGRNFIFSLLIASIMVPYQALVIPLFIVITNGIPGLTGIQLINSHWALILPGMCSPVAIFLMRQYIQTLPGSLEEAARIDGCGELGIWWRVILPLSKPILAAWGILSFTGIWKSFFWPFVIIGYEPYFPLEVGLQTIQQQHTVEYGLVMAGATISAVPMILIFLLFQKQIVQGLTAGAVKG